MQQRNDLSDADETDIKKKKRKRSLTREMSNNSGTLGKTGKGATQSPRKSQKVTLSESGKNVIKIPVGGALGALSGVRNLSQPSPAKKPRTSKSKSNKVNAQVAVAALKTISEAEAASRPLMQTVPMNSAASAAITASTNPQSTPGFISLAATGSTSMLKPSVTQSYLTVSGSPSIMKQTTGAVQYIIKPQSQRQLPPQTGTVTLTSAAVTQSTSASGVRYTSLSPSPTSPFTSVLNLKGNGTSQGVLGPASATTVPRTGVSTSTVRTVLGQQADALKRTISGKSIAAGKMLPSQQISMSQLSSTTSLPTSLQSNRMTTVTSAAHLKSSSAGSHIQGTSGQVSKSLQMNSQRVLGQHSQVRYIVGPTSNANHPGTVLVTTQGGVIRAVGNTAHGRTSSPQLSTAKSYSPSGITQGAQQRPSPSISVSGTSRPQSAPAKASGTITYVLTTSAAAARSASPQTSVTSKTQVWPQMLACLLD